MNWMLLAQTEGANGPGSGTGFDRALAQIELFARTKGLEFAGNLALALLILVIGRYAARILERVFEGFLRRARVDETLAQFLGNIAYALMITFVIIAAISRLGVNTTSLTAIIAAAGLAVGFALQDSLSNFASGVMLILFRPFEVGNFVEAAGTAGIVEGIHIFHTIMKTPDNQKIVVPNSSITGGSIKNFSALPTRRINLTIQCGYEDDLLAVKEFLWEVIRNDDRVLDDPAPFVGVTELAASGVNFAFRPWTKSEDWWATQCDMTEKIKLGFDERGFTIPYPTQDIHVHQTQGGSAIRAE